MDTITTGIICLIVTFLAIAIAIAFSYADVPPTLFDNDSWYIAFFALVINYAIVFTITLGFQSLVPTLLDFFGDEKDKNAKNVKNSSVWSLIFIGILLVFWLLILFIFPNSIQNGLPLNTGYGWMRIILGTLPAEWILPLIQGVTFPEVTGSFFIDNSWMTASVALLINYAIVFLITFGGQSLAPNLPDFFGNEKDKTAKNAKNSSVWSLIFIGILLVFWSLILFIFPNSIQNGLPLDTAWGLMRIFLGTLPAEWILPLFEGFTPTFTAATASNTAISDYAGIGGKKGKKKGKKGGGFLGGDDAGSIPAAQWSQIFWTTTK